MKSRAKFRLFRRGTGIFFVQDNASGRQESLRTRDRAEAKRLFAAYNEAHEQPAINLQIARAYLTATDPKLVKRTWQEVMDQIVSMKEGPTEERWAKAILDRSFDPLRNLTLVETRADHFLKALANHKSSTNVYLRRIHNFALAMDWLLKPVIPRREWPKVNYRKKRAITADEHARIIARERNPERRDMYDLLWHLGGSQSDVAGLHAEDIDWKQGTVSYVRRKLNTRMNTRLKPARIRFGEAVGEVFRRLPSSGPLFPNLIRVPAKDRASEFRQRCSGLGIVGVTLHSYRYAWAERARACGYPMRFAQEALGHNSKAVHAAYAKHADVQVPSLDTWERDMCDKIVVPRFATKPQDEEVVNNGGLDPVPVPTAAAQS